MLLKLNEEVAAAVAAVVRFTAAAAGVVDFVVVAAVLPSTAEGACLRLVFPRRDRSPLPAWWAAVQSLGVASTHPGLAAGR
jgi:hypothetical protein